MADEAKIAMDEARELVSDRTLWPLVRDFLWDFASQVHPSWTEGLWRAPSDAGREAEDCAPIASRLMSSDRIKGHVLAALGVSPCFHTFPKDDWSRVLLLDGRTLEAIAKWLGALVGANELRRVTNGATVRDLKSALSGVYPEVFGYEMYFNGLLEAVEFERGGAEGVDAPNVAEGVVLTGFSMLQSLVASLPMSLVSRLKFKLPRHVGRSETPCEVKDKAGNMATVFAKLLKLKFPEAYKLCC